MRRKTERQLCLEDWAASLAVEQKQLPAETMQKGQENVVPVRGKWRYHPLYQVWRNIKCRCFTPSNTDFHRYGGRGIIVCSRWMDFELFAKDMGPRPSKDHTIDRIDSNGNYEPGNCRWATRKEQSAHTSRNRKLEFAGRVMTVTEWAKALRISSSILFGRLYSGWKIDDILTKPVRV